MWDRTRHLAEAFAFSFLVVAYIWLRPLWWSWSLLIPLALVAVSFVWHSESFESVGFSLRAFLGAVVAWRWWLASCAASLIALTWLETATRFMSSIAGADTPPGAFCNNFCFKT